MKAEELVNLLKESDEVATELRNSLSGAIESAATAALKNRLAEYKEFDEGEALKKALIEDLAAKARKRIFAKNITIPLALLLALAAFFGVKQFGPIVDRTLDAALEAKRAAVQDIANEISKTAVEAASKALIASEGAKKDAEAAKTSMAALEAELQEMNRKLKPIKDAVLKLSADDTKRITTSIAELRKPENAELVKNLGRLVISTETKEWKWDQPGDNLKRKVEHTFEFGRDVAFAYVSAVDNDAMRIYKWSLQPVPRMPGSFKLTVDQVPSSDQWRMEVRVVGVKLGIEENGVPQERTPLERPSEPKS